MAYRRGSSLVVQREYSYDILGRPTDFTAMTADNNMIGVNCAYDSMGRRTYKRVTLDRIFDL